MAAMTAPPTAIEKQYLGFKNQLSNPGFEQGKLPWTVTTTAFTVTTTSTEIAEGSRAAEWNPAGVESLRSGSWTPKTNATSNGVAFCKVRSNADADYDLEVYDGSSVVSGAEVDIAADTNYRLYVINFVAAGGTSYSVQVTSAGNDDEIQVDDCGIGNAEGYNIANISQTMFAGESYFAGTASCGNWTRLSTTIGAFASDTDCPGPTVVRSNIGDWQTTDANLPIQTINNLPPGIYKATFHAGANLTTNNAAALAINDGTTTCEANYAQSIATNYAETTVSCTFSYTSAGNRSFQLYGASNAGTLTIDNSITTPRISLRFMLERYPLSSQQVYTTDQSDYGWTAYTPTFTGFGTAASIDFKHRRIGSDLLVTGRFVAGTPTAVEPRISLPSGLTSASSSILPATLSLAGTTTTTGSSATFFEEKVLIEPSTTYMVFGKQSSTTGGATKSASASADFATGATVFVNARIPIDGWQTSNKAPQLVNSVISGLNGVSLINSAYITYSGGVPSVSTQSGTWISSVTDVGLGDSRLNFTAGTWSAAPHCVAQLQASAGSLIAKISEAATTSLVEVELYDLAGTRSDTNYYIICMGQK